VAVAINALFVRKSGPLLESDSVSADAYKKFIMKNQDILDINLGDITSKSTVSQGEYLNKQKIFSQLDFDMREEILVYYGDDRGNIRILDISSVLTNCTSREIEKTPYYPSQKVSFIPKRKGFYQIDKIGVALIKMAKAQKLPNLQNYNDI
jgi:hypothetical protein